jgi:hypothetical protein
MHFDVITDNLRVGVDELTVGSANRKSDEPFATAKQALAGAPP